MKSICVYTIVEIKKYLKMKSNEQRNDVLIIVPYEGPIVEGITKEKNQETGEIIQQKEKENDDESYEKIEKTESQLDMEKLCDDFLVKNIITTQSTPIDIDLYTKRFEEFPTDLVEFADHNNIQLPQLTSLRGQSHAVILLQEITKKGSRSSINGKKYELQVYNILKNSKLNGNNFNTQNDDELGGCSSKNDIECNMLSERDISIEIKKLKTPDWMQCSLKYDNINSKWIGSTKNKIPEASKGIFEKLISTITLFNGNIPPFMLKDITHKEWVKIKKETTDYNDIYIDCPNDTIMNLYGEKNCSYIQISEKGLYHLGNDVCDFKVPAFICEQRLRVRTKIHEKKNKNGFCKLSVTIACQPKNIKNLINSEYSLDNHMKLPLNLNYDDYIIWK